MLHVATAVGMFMLFTFTHVILYRINLVRLQLFRVLSVYLIWLFVGIMLIHHLSDESARLALPVTSTLFYSLLCLLYMAQCIALQHGSPSLLILDLIDQEANKRVSMDALSRAFTNEKLLLPRLDDLVREGYLSFDGQRYTLQLRGILVAHVIASYRKLIGRGLGG